MTQKGEGKTPGRTPGRTDHTQDLFTLLNFFKYLNHSFHTAENVVPQSICGSGGKTKLVLFYVQVSRCTVKKEVADLRY